MIRVAQAGKYWWSRKVPTVAPTRLARRRGNHIRQKHRAIAVYDDVCRATIRVRARDNQGERVLRGFRRREGGTRPEAEPPQKSAEILLRGTGRLVIATDWVSGWIFSSKGSADCRRRGEISSAECLRDRLDI